MVLDETLYPNPRAFIPERHDETVDESLRKSRDPRQYVFALFDFVREVAAYIACSGGSSGLVVGG